MKSYFNLKNIFCLTLLFLPSMAFADGGGPILLFISIIVFTYGQIWILSSEYIYLCFLFKKMSKLRLLLWVVLANLISTLIGGVLIPGALIIAGWYGGILGDKGFSSGYYLFALGSWVVGDYSPHAALAINMVPVWFVSTYFLTVWIEYRVIYKLQKKSNLISKKKLLLNSFFWNLISYLGMIAIFLYKTHYPV